MRLKNYIYQMVMPQTQKHGYYKYIKMNLTYTIHNESIIKNKALILNSDYDCKKLFVKPVVKKNNYYLKNNNYKKEEKDYESDKDDIIIKCDFID